MPSNLQHPALVTIRKIFEKIIDIPYCTGTAQLNALQSLLFYRSKDESGFIDFANPTEIQLKALVEACSPASFAKNHEIVLDENYQNVGAMDSANFSTQFSLWDSGILDTVVDFLFKPSLELMAYAKVELYKLHVYGPGSFCKAHVVTPASDDMFGSLVVILPTPHTGGSVLLRHSGTEYTFDPAKAISGSSTDTPHAAFAAFFSDVEHEVAEVTSGYRVTLTYHLYHTKRRPSDGQPGIAVENTTQIASALKTALTSLLTAPNFLPDGGLLAFGLRNHYPCSPGSTNLQKIKKNLKGTDALLKHVCGELELKVSVMALYCEDPLNDTEYCFTKKFTDFVIDCREQEDVLEAMCKDHHGTIIVGYDALSGRRAPTWPKRSTRYTRPQTVKEIEILPVVWASELREGNGFKEWYAGGFDFPGCVHGKVCLVVRIKSAKERG